MTRFILLLLVILLDDFCCAGSQLQQNSFRLNVSAKKTLHVTRGKNVAITSDHYSIVPSGHYSNAIMTCNMVYASSNENCGHISPTTLPCWNQETPNLYHYYQHHGCFNHYETLHFQVNARMIINETDVIAIEHLSLSLRILPNQNVSLKIQTVKDDKDNVVINFLFPTFFTNKCSYTVMDRLPYKGISAETEVNGSLSLPIPCGYSPTTPFTYSSRRLSSKITSLFVHTNCFTEDSTYYVVPLTLNDTLNKSTFLMEDDLIHLNDSYMNINELSETLLSPGTLPIDLKEFQGYANRGGVKFLFPVDYTGGFYPYLSLPQNPNTATTFTMTELLRNRVVFKPTERSIATHVSTVTMFHYNLLDFIGRPLARGTLYVKLSPRKGRDPSIRKNIGISVERGGKAFITSNEFNLYPPHLCTNYTVRMVALPRLGSVYVSGRDAPLGINDTFQVEENNLNILYVQDHINASHYASDATLWSLECDMVKKQDGSKGSPPLDVLIPIRITSSLTTTHCTVVTLSQCVTPLHLSECSLPTGPVTITALKQQLVDPGDFIATPSSHCLTGSYPYYTLSRSQSCLGDLNKHNRSHGNDSWWYVSHNITSEVVKEYKLASIKYNYSVLLRVKILPRFNFVATKRLPNASISSPSHFPSAPFVQRNKPLPLSSPQPVYITADYLCISSTGYLEKEIVYHISSQPLYGILCLLDNTNCIASIRSFTQADLTANRIYYKPESSTMHPVNDSFSFQLFYFEGREKLPQEIRFQFVSVQEVSLLIPYRQFWISNEREKALTRKYFRHIQWYMGTNRLHFRVISGPHHGTLNTPDTPKEFLWEDLTKRSVTYEHRPLEDHCSDTLTLQVTRLTDRFSIITNISIAIKASTGDVLSITTNDHPLELEKEFTLSENDFQLQSSFCLSFIKFRVTSLPSYGLLRYRDPAINVLKELNINSSFTGQDILEGRVTYRILPSIIFYRNTTDTFSTVLEDPQGVTDSKSGRPKRSSPSSVFLIILIQEPLSELRFNLTVSPSIMMSTATNDRYGVMFTEEDIYLTDDSDFLPSEISLYLKSSSPPRFGHIQKDDYQTSHFTLSDVYENRISYISTLSHSDFSVTSDSFELIVKISYGNHTNPGHVESNITINIDWCYFNLSGRGRVDETADYEYHVIYIGGNNPLRPVHVNVTTLEGVSDDSATPGIDYHPINKRLTFTSHARKAVGYVSIINDSNAEGNELFVMGLRDSDVCIIPKHSEISVYITDYIDDYPLFAFSNNSQYISQLQPKSSCSLSLEVPESVGSFNITILRTKNTLQRNRVICHTVTDPGLSTEYVDYVGRPNNISSAVIFNRGETQANCTIRIIDDDENERLEMFYVELKGLVTENSFVNNGSSQVCVYIVHDKNDVPKVSFKNSRIVVRENFAGNLSFSIVRTGDLSSKTQVYFRVHSGNATENKDYIFHRSSNNIQFIKGQSEAKGFVEILQDNEKESNEVFNITIFDSFNGAISGNRELEIVIQDTVKDVFVNFSSKTYQVNETDIITEIPVFRHGNLSTPTTVTCTMSSITADDQDYFNAPRTLTFQINETRKECNLFLNDDDLREGRETLRVIISTNDSRVETDEAIIIINDPEDASVVEFEDSIVYITEPISNFKVDRTEVQLSVKRRKGLNVKASIDYYTFENATMSHESTKSYNSSRRRITFAAGVERVNVTIPVHYEALQNDEIFYAQLIGNNVTRLGQQDRMTIVVKNRILKGVYFPADPVITSYVKQSVQFNPQGAMKYHDLPLLCETACDKWHDECTQQGIDVQKTIYEWWISENGESFFQIKRDTFLTTTASRTLSPVYFSRNVWIKCVTKAVDESGVQGYSRTSNPILIGNETFYKYQQNHSKIEVKFETYASFQGNKKDFVELVVAIPALPNSIPLITSKPILSPLLYVLTRPSARNGHSCSNLIPSSGLTSLLSEESQGLDKYLIKGVWVFRKWLQLQSILNACPVSFYNGEEGSLSLSMPLYVTELTIRNGVPVIINSSKHNMTLDSEGLPANESASSFPFNYQPIEKSNYQKISFSAQSIDVQPLNKISLFGYTNYSRGSLQKPIIRIIVEGSSNALLPSSHEESNENIINGWIIETSLRNNISFDVKICPNNDDDASIGGLSNCASFPFKIPLTAIDKQLVLSSELESNAVILNKREANMYSVSGKNVLKLSIYLHRSFVMKPQFELVVDEVILKHNEQERVLLDTLRERKSSSHVTMYFILDGMHINSNSFILTNSSVRLNPDGIKYWEFETIASLPQLHIEDTPTPTAATGTDNPITGTNSTLPLYAFMLILITAVILASVCTITCALLVYTLRQRWLLKTKSNLIQDAPIEIGLRDSRPKRNTRRKGRDFKGHSSYSLSSSSSSPQSRGFYSPSITPISDTHPSVLARSKSLPDLSSVSPPFDTFSLTPPGSTGSESPPTPPTEGSRIVLTKIIPIKERHKSLMHELWRISENARGMSSEMDERLSTSSNNDDAGAGNIKGAPQGVGWYERFQTRQKSLELYSKMYSKATPAAEQKTDDAKVPDDKSIAILCQVEMHDDAVGEDLNEDLNCEETLETKMTVEA